MVYQKLLAEHNLWSRYQNHKSGSISETGDSIGNHGLCSNPDSRLAFQRTDQFRWKAFSENVIQEMCKKLLAGDTFYDIYSYGASKRTEISTELQQGVRATEDRTYEYGLRKAEHYEAYEMFTRQPQAAWKNQSGTVLRLIQKLCKTNPEERVNFTLETSYGSEYQIIVESPVKGQMINGENHSRFLSHIQVTCDFSIAKITYAMYNKYDFQGDMELAEKYLEECRQWRYSGRWSIENLLKSVGRLSHLLAHLLPVQLGNAGIMGWIQRAIALSRGVQLGDYSQRECKFTQPFHPEKDTIISWDFMALVTPDREKYAEWFAQYAFIDYSR